MVAEKNESFHPLWIGCTVLVNHMVAQVVGLPEEVMGEADLKEQAVADIKNKFKFCTNFLSEEI